MNKDDLELMLGVERGDFELMGALEFENFICEKLSKFGKVFRQVGVENRGDGRKGKIDIVFAYRGLLIPIELDRKTIREKSRFKVLSYNPTEAFCITRSPFEIHKVIPSNG